MARNLNYVPVGWEDGTVLQPAKVTVQGVEYDVEPQVVSGTTPVNSTNLRKMDNAIEEIIEEDIPSLLDVELIAVVDTAPSECSTGDKYYNTTTNKIYTATGINTWGTNGETPLDGILYIVFDEQTTYAYNGTTLVSVGGGAEGNGVYVGDEPPVDAQENDLWVDTNDEEHLAEVDDEVSTTSTNAVQNQAITNYVNGLNTYSTAEQVVGKWIDGKPIYRKVFTGITANAEYTEITLDFEAITNFSGYFTDGNWVNLLPFYIYISPDEKFMCFYGNPTTRKIYLQYSSAYRNKNYSLVVEYTKTTD